VRHVEIDNGAPGPILYWSTLCCDELFNDLRKCELIEWTHKMCD